MTKELWEGPCRGGPMDGQTGQSRFSNGFLLADKPNGRAWIYDWNEKTQEFVCRDAVGDTLDEAGRRKAANGLTYDVRAVD